MMNTINMNTITHRASQLKTLILICIDTRQSPIRIRTFLIRTIGMTIE